MGAVKKFLFGNYKTPEVEVKQSAPKLDEPVEEVKSPELGGEGEDYARKRRGKSRLKSTPNSNVSRGVGLNIYSKLLLCVFSVLHGKQ